MTDTRRLATGQVRAIIAALLRLGGAGTVAAVSEGAGLPPAVVRRGPVRSGPPMIRAESRYFTRAGDVWGSPTPGGRSAGSGPGRTRVVPGGPRPVAWSVSPGADMTIDGVSQTTGLERLVDVGAEAGGLRLTIRDRKLGAVLGSVTVPAESLMAVLTEQPEGPQPLEGTLEVEVRRNEVLLTLGGPDAAVGLDDLMDAVGGTLPGGGDA